MKKNIRSMKNSLRSLAGGGLSRALAFTLLALLMVGIGSGTAAGSTIRLGYVDDLQGAQAAAAEARLAALNEAVFLFEYFNQDTRVQLHTVDINSPSLMAELRNMDAIVTGRAEDLDSLIAARSVVVTGQAFAAPSSATAEGLVDSVTAFVEGSAGLIVDSVGDSVAAREWMPPEIAAIEPNSAAPDENVSIKFRNAGYMRAGDFRVRFSHASGERVLGGTIEPLINLEEAFRMEGYVVGVPHGAVSGGVEFQLPSQGTPAISRSLQSPEPFEVLAIAPPPDDEIPLPVPSSCDIVSWHRLGSPNYFSEVADSKDLVISDVDLNGRPDVFIPQTNSQLDMLYKHLGNDAAGLPNFATIISGLVTNDVTPKRQYGVAAGDLDGDLYPEMIPTGATPQNNLERLRILVNNRNLTFTNQASSLIVNWSAINGSVNRWDEAKIVDIDGDGDPDFALANRTSGAPSAVVINNGDGTFTAFPSGFGDPSFEVHHDLVFCDVDGDNDPDAIFSQDQGSNRPLRLHINLGGSPPAWADASSRLIPNPGHDSEHLGCQDFNNDGRLDIHAGTFIRSDVTNRQDMIYLNETVDSNGNGSIEISEIKLTLVPDPDPFSPVNQGFKARTYSANYGDFNGDGFIDIINGTYLPGPVSQRGPFLMCNNGDGTFTHVSPLNNYWPDLSNTGFEHFSPTGTRVADLNADGLLDIVFAMGDGLNDASEEVNRIFIQKRIGGGGGGCLQLALRRPCRIDEPIELLSIGSSSLEEVVLSPLAGFCRDLVECPPCGGRYAPCRKSYNVVLDFQAVGLDPKVATIEIIDFEGNLVARGHNSDGRKILSFTPDGHFKARGIDQELYLTLKLKKAVGQPVQVPISLEVLDR